MSEAPAAIRLLPLRGIPAVEKGDDLAALLSEAAQLVSLGLVCHAETPITDLSNAALRVRLGYEEAVGVLDG